MCNIVTKRFIQCVERLKELNEIKSLRQFALSIDYHPQNLSDIMKGNRDVTIEVIKNAAETYKINPLYIFTGEGNEFLHGANDVENQNVKVVKSLEKILYVPTAAHAGYAEQIGDPVFMDELVSFSLPDYKFQHGDYRCFDIVGDSMEPSLHAGDKVVCSLVDINAHYNSLRNNLVYVVVLESGIVVKRIQNNISVDRSILLVSDNNYYEPQKVDITQVKEIWHVEVKISPYLPSPNNMRNAFHEEIDSLRKTITTQANALHSLNSTVEKLLKQNRSYA